MKFYLLIETMNSLKDYDEVELVEAVKKDIKKHVKGMFKSEDITRMILSYN